MMLLNVSTSPSEDESRVRELLFANLLRVFNERDPSKRSTAIQEIYAEDVIWYESDVIVQGHAVLNTRASEIQAQSPGFNFSTDGGTSVCQNVGVLRFCFGPEDKPDLVRGTDIMIVEGGKVKALWTCLDSAPGK